jgi:hypothetical protein
LLGSVSAQVLARVDRFASEMVRRGQILENCASKYAQVSAGKADALFAAYAPGEAAVINIGGIDLELEPVSAGGGLIVMGGHKARQPDAGREVLLALDYVNLYRSGLNKSVQLLLTREGDHSCVPSRVGCRVHDASLTLIRYDIWGSSTSPELRWAAEEKLGAVQVEVVCGSARRSSDPFFTVPWYEYAVAYFMKLIAVLAGE